jgi:hypothetical protein
VAEEALGNLSEFLVVCPAPQECIEFPGFIYS